jgi:hypothetical protein
MLRLLVFPILLALSAVSVSSQSPGTGSTDPGVLPKLRQLHLSEITGALPVDYVAASQDRAVAYQKSLAPAYAWFEHELNLHVPMVLYVLDQEAYAKVGEVSWPMPYSDHRRVPSVVVFPAHIEDLIGKQQDTNAPGEDITYHEAGHNFAYAAKIWSANQWVNELIANMFASAYVEAKRPDLEQLRKANESAATEKPRYTSLRDLDYVYVGVGFQNYVWFQMQMAKLADFLVAGQDFSTVVMRLRAEFPSEGQKQETLDRIAVHLERVRPGATEFLKPLMGPSALAILKSSSCPASGGDKNAQPIPVAVRNDSGSALEVVDPDDGKITIATQTWKTFYLRPGTFLKLPDGTCIVQGNEPALAVIGAQ